MSKFEEAAKPTTIPPHGYWEATLVINGEVPEHRLNKDFLRLLDASNPRYTGWPVWMNTETFKDLEKRPRVHNGVYEILIADMDGSLAPHIDFMRFDPKGKFYLRRAYQDDVIAPHRGGPKPFTVLDFGLPIIRTAEVIAVGLAFAKAMGCKPETSSLSYLFAWHKLKGRTLSTWANPERMIWGSETADRDEAKSHVDLPLDTPLSRLGFYTKKATDPLFDVFDEKISQDVIDDLATRLTSRTLSR